MGRLESIFRYHRCSLPAGPLLLCWSVRVVVFWNWWYMLIPPTSTLLDKVLMSLFSMIFSLSSSSADSLHQTPLHDSVMEVTRTSVTWAILRT